jgi:enamine deaminase RidA (YjgF/YER057c/UK114 family)
MTIKRLAEEQRLSGATVANGFIFLAGQIADDSSLDAEGQTADILAQIDALLAEAGTDKSALLQVQITLADITDAPGMNRAWDRWLDTAPSRRG